MRRGRAGDISHFLLAVVDAVNLQAGEQPRRIYTFCKVGSGYTIPELTDLRDRLRDKWRPYDKRRPPAWLQGWRPEQGDVPDMVIEPRDSVIVEVKCYEIIPCPASKFLAEFTCRFPRVTRFRYSDKQWYEAESIDHIRQLAAHDRVKGRKLDEKAAGHSPPHSPLSDQEECGGGGGGGSSQLDGQWGLAGQLAASQDGIVDGQGGGGKNGKKRTRRQADEGSQAIHATLDNSAERAQRQGAAAALGGVLPLFQPASGLSGIERRSSVLAGLSVVVMVQPDCQPSKADLERLVVEHGGEVRQNPPGPRDCSVNRRYVLLSDGQSSYKLQAHQRSGRFDIVHYSWVMQCVAQGRLSRYKQDEIISATAATSSERSRQVDQYGDEFEEALQSISDVRRIVDAVRQRTRVKQQQQQHTAHSDGDHPAAVNHSSGQRSRQSETRVKLSPLSPPRSPASAAEEDALHSCVTLLAQCDPAVAALRPRLFDSVSAAVVLDEQQAADSQQASEAAVVQCALVLNGATLCSSSTSSRSSIPLTHCVVCSPSADCPVADGQGQSARVTAAWVIDSLRTGKLQNEADYVS